MVQTTSIRTYINVYGAEMTFSEDFESFFNEAEASVRRALVSKFGAELGREAAAEAFVAAWRSWTKIRTVESPAGYVYRIGERWAARQTSKPRVATRLFPTEVADRYVDIDLAEALATLTDRQRQAVALVAGLGMTHAQAADFMGCARSSVQNHVERGLARLRACLEVADNA